MKCLKLKVDKTKRFQLKLEITKQKLKIIITDENLFSFSNFIDKGYTEDQFHQCIWKLGFRSNNVPNSF